MSLITEAAEEEKMLSSHENRNHKPRQNHVIDCHQRATTTIIHSHTDHHTGAAPYSPLHHQGSGRAAIHVSPPIVPRENPNGRLNTFKPYNPHRSPGQGHHQGRHNPGHGRHYYTDPAGHGHEYELPPIGPVYATDPPISSHHRFNHGFITPPAEKKHHKHSLDGDYHTISAHVPLMNQLDYIGGVSERDYDFGRDYSSLGRKIGLAREFSDFSQTLGQNLGQDISSGSLGSIGHGVTRESEV